ELIAFDVRDERALAIDHDRVQRMVQQPFVWIRAYAEHVTDTLNVGDRSGQEMPLGGVGAPLTGVLGEHCRRIVSGIEGDGQEDEIAPQLALKALLERIEGACETETEVWQRAAR